MLLLYICMVSSTKVDGYLHTFSNITSIFSPFTQINFEVIEAVDKVVWWNGVVVLVCSCISFLSFFFFFLCALWCSIQVIIHVRMCTN